MADSILQDLTGISLPVTGTDVLPLARGTDPLAKATVADLVIAQSQVTSLTSDLSGKQPLDADLTAIAALSPSNDDVLQRKAGAWLSTFAGGNVSARRDDDELAFLLRLL